MPKTKSEDPKSRQVLARLTAYEMEVVSAIAHLEGVTPNALVRRLVEQEIRRMEAHPRVVADLANRRAYVAEKAGEVVPLAAGRARKGRGGAAKR